MVRIRRVAWTNASLRGRKFVVLGLHDPGVGRIFPIFALDGQGQAIALRHDDAGRPNLHIGLVRLPGRQRARSQDASGRVRFSVDRVGSSARPETEVEPLTPVPRVLTQIMSFLSSFIGLRSRLVTNEISSSRTRVYAGKSSGYRLGTRHWHCGRCEWADRVHHDCEIAGLSSATVPSNVSTTRVRGAPGIVSASSRSRALSRATRTGANCLPASSLATALRPRPVAPRIQISFALLTDGFSSQSS